ncbi:hypothetical protein TrVFT333_010465 [Trichoderma virens FT-333]|nr:hypothetical protein TrVFT333_010465 [Trichoderma virens FT-333]
MRRRLDEYKKDDVFNETFLANVIFLESRKRHRIDKHSITKETIKFLKEHGMKQCIFSSSPNYLPGPHVMVGQELREVWKLVDDSNGTCMVTLKPQQDPSDAFEALSIRGRGSRALSFALPSRIKSSAQSLPLSGLRILIKDNIHLKGVKTSVGNRAFYDAYPPQEKTARADGYQSSGGSSSGSASAIAAYDWLDVAIGTDTWGALLGLLTGVDVLACVLVLGVSLRTASCHMSRILARDLQKCKKFAKEWLDFDIFEKAPESFSSIIWPTDFWNIIDSKQKSLAQSFAQEMATKLNVKFEEISFEERWKNVPPSDEAPLLPATASLAYDVYHNSEDFRSRHWNLFKCAPYTTIQNERLWSVGKNITPNVRDEGFQRIDIYRRWFLQHVWTGDHTNAITVMPPESAVPRYRDDVPDFQRPPQDGINALSLGPVMKSPVLAVPIAEIPYHSRVSNQQEQLPFAVALMGTPGTDLKLLGTTIEILSSLNLPTALQVGKYMYKVQDI